MVPFGMSYRRLVAMKMARDFEKAFRYGDAAPDDAMDARIEEWIDRARTLPERKPYAKKKQGVA